MQFNSRADLTDPSIGENILKQVSERNLILDLILSIHMWKPNTFINNLILLQSCPISKENGIILIRV